MNKPWIGYLSAALLLLAGILQIAGGNPKLGALFIVLSVISLAIKLYIQRNNKSR